MAPQRKISLFLFLTLALSLLSYVPITHAGTLNVNGGLFVFTLMYSPGLAAMLTQLIATHSLRDLGWRFGSARWLGLAYFLPVVYAFTWLTGIGAFSNPCLFASIAEKYSSPNLATTVVIILLLELTGGWPKT